MAPDPRLIEQLAAACRSEVKQRRQLLGWWLPLFGASGFVVVGLLLSSGWVLMVIGIAMMAVFHRYQRWKLVRAFEAPPRFCFGVLGPIRELSRGHRQSHGLMYPVSVQLSSEYSVGRSEDVLPLDREELFWVDSNLLDYVQEGDEVGLLQVGQEAVVVLSREAVVFVAHSLPLESELRARVEIALSARQIR